MTDPAADQPKKPTGAPAAVAGSRADRSDQAADLLRSAGLRRMPGRIALIAVLLSGGASHLTASELEEKMRASGWHADLSSIHRATAALAGHGLLHTLSTPGPVAYGVAVPAHHHVICSSCGTVTEVSTAQLGAASAAVRRALCPVGFQLQAAGLTVHGLCLNCAHRDRHPATRSCPPRCRRPPTAEEQGSS